MGERRDSANGRNAASHDTAAIGQRGRRARRAPARPIRNICVYCGSSPGRNSAYAEAARRLGAEMAQRGIGLVYGGGGLGLMGAIAQSVLANGGRVTGVIPEFLSEREHMLREVTELVVVADMHQRKKLMFDRSDAFVALPGGIGTLEELVEQLTWAQLGRHSKPIVLFNVEDFWAPFVTLLNHLRGEAFIRQSMDVRFTVADSAQGVIDAVCATAQPARPSAEVTVTEKF